MSDTFIIKPATEDKVRDPITKQHLAAEGEEKPRTTYWLRRLMAGEVVEVSNQQASEAAKQAKK